MLAYCLFLTVHVLGACIWVGGHLVLATRVLPRALRERKASLVSDFEQDYDRIGLLAFAVQIVTGLWLAHRLLGTPDALFAASPLARVIQLKLLLLAATAALAVHA
jgi:uncharacterized membrane protein